MTALEINQEIAQMYGDKNAISDGYHTFGELYEVRCILFVAVVQAHKKLAWRASRNADGQKWDGWFVCGMQPQSGRQITFHLPDKFWGNLDGIETHDINPYFDGHSSSDVIKRLYEFINLTPTNH